MNEFFELIITKTIFTALFISLLLVSFYLSFKFSNFIFRIMKIDPERYKSTHVAVWLYLWFLIHSNLADLINEKTSLFEDVISHPYFTQAQDCPECNCYCE